jgi:filamentous hemagglutinin family protein
MLAAAPRVIALAVSLALLHAGAAHAGPLPQTGQFVAGSGSISGGGQALTINQTSTRGVIDWHSFSIGAGRSVTFNNGSGATLNRVTGGDPSVIMGRLLATGSVYLINPQGVLVGPGGVVSTGGRFVASSLDVNNNAFMQGGPLTFSGGGNGAVVNLGQIGSSGGDVFLVSRLSVSNNGSIDAPQGSAELAAGQQVLLNDSSAGRQVFVQAGSHGAVLNAGAIRAAQVSLQAADGNVFALAGNHAAIRASGTALRDGHVWLVADQGTVHAHEAISAVNANGSGGTVETTGSALDIVGANVSAGLWKLGSPTFTLDGSNAATLASNLGNGTAVDVEATGAHGQSGNLQVSSNVQWSGGASLTLGAAHDVTIAPNATIRNSGTGDLTLRADANAVDNRGSVINHGTIDWSASKGFVSMLYDMKGSYTPGTILANAAWKPAQFSGLVTQVTAYKLVNNLTDLQNVSQDLAGNYALGTNIDASSTFTTPFTPIAASSATPFTGQFDGMGHTIANLSISTATYTVDTPLGLFGVTGPGSVVRNVGVTNAEVGNPFGIFGALAGVNYGLITYAYSSGDVRNLSVTGYVGGLVGENYGTVERSWSSAGVGSQTVLGGLVGLNAGTITQSYATGGVGGGSHGQVGGLVGVNSGTISESYATGGASSLLGAAGLVFENTKTGVIKQSFAAEPVGGGPPLAEYAGVVAANDGTIANNVYWDAQVSGRPHAVYIGTGKAPPDSNGLTTSQMGMASSYDSSWNFSTAGAWAIPSGAVYPVLRWQLTQ